MNLAKVAAVIIGGIVVFFVLDSVVHVLLGLLGAVLFLAVIGGGGYVAYKMVGGRRRAGTAPPLLSFRGSRPPGSLPGDGRARFSRTRETARPAVTRRPRPGRPASRGPRGPGPWTTGSARPGCRSR